MNKQQKMGRKPRDNEATVMRLTVRLNHRETEALTVLRNHMKGENGMIAASSDVTRRLIMDAAQSLQSVTPE